MKRIFLSLIMTLTIAVTAMQAKTLVAFYSYTGNCKAIANALTSQVEADVLEIQPAEKGLKYDANNYALATKLLNAINANPDDADSYPPIDLVDVSISDYQNIIIVTPLWWSQMAAPMQTFLFHFGKQMAGKHIGLIVSSASSGISGVEKDCKRLLPDGNYYSKSLWIRSSQVSRASSLVSEWLKQINFSDDAPAESMMIRVYDAANTIVYQLNQTSAAQSLYAMLPLQLTVQNYGNNEKIFYPPADIAYGDDCIEGDCPAGTLALFSPWGNVVMYYGDASRYSGLYILGTAVEGADKIRNLTGTIRVEAVGDASAIQTIQADTNRTSSMAYTLSGTPATDGHTGIIIRNGKKYLTR